MNFRVLITGFEPFGSDALNPSEAIARALDGRVIGGATVMGRVLPCVFGESARRLLGWVEELQPSLVMCVGQAGGRDGISLERVAINVDDARIPDNAGVQPIDAPIVATGPAAYWSTLPIKAIVADLRDAGFTAGVSQTAGTFVCNHIFYTLMHAVANRQAVQVERAGFVHVPWLPEQPGAAERGEPSVALERQIAAIERAVAVSLESQERELAGGAEH